MPSRLNSSSSPPVIDLLAGGEQQALPTADPATFASSAGHLRRRPSRPPAPPLYGRRRPCLPSAPSVPPSRRPPPPALGHGRCSSSLRVDSSLSRAVLPDCRPADAFPSLCLFVRLRITACFLVWWLCLPICWLSLACCICCRGCSAPLPSGIFSLSSAHLFSSNQSHPLL